MTIAEASKRMALILGDKTLSGGECSEKIDELVEKFMRDQTAVNNFKEAV